MKLRLRNFMKEINFKSVDEVVYGIQDGYLVSITDENGAASMYVDLVLPDTNCKESEAIRNIIRLNSKQYSILRAEVNETGVLVVFPSSFSAFNKLKDFFYFFLQQLKSEGIKGASTCTNCGNPISSIKIVSMYNRLHTCDSECAEQLVSSYKPKRRKIKPLFIPGFLGAVIGAAVGAVPLLVLGQLNIFSLWCGLFIGLLAKVGYELLGGKPCIGKTIVLPILSLIAIVPTVFYTYCLNLFDIWLGRDYIVEKNPVIEIVYNTILSDKTLQMTLITDVLIAFAFAILGLLLVMRFTRKTHKEEVFIV